MTSYISPSNVCGLPPGESDASPRQTMDWSLATIAALLLLTVLFSWLRQDPQFACAPSWYWRMKLSWKSDADFVCVGDSTVYRGLNPKVFEEAGIATQALNFGFSSVALSREYLLSAASKFKQGAPEKRLLVGVTQWALTPRARTANDFVAARREESESHLPIEWLIALDSLLAGTRPIPIDLIFRSKGDPTTIARATKSDYIETYHMNGWVESDYLHADWTRGLATQRINFDHSNMVQAALIEEARSTLQQIQDRDDVQVILVTMRSHPEVDALSDQLSGMDLTALAHMLRPTRGEVFEFHPDTGDSYDGIHLSSACADRLSHSLADFAKQPSPR